ncbi:MAG: hypothetical protein HPY90_13885 [Syntrophothermus sp.]|nr:hypothetical protein [Syntrophothermus sp.]
MTAAACIMGAKARWAEITERHISFWDERFDSQALLVSPVFLLYGHELPPATGTRFCEYLVATMLQEHPPPRLNLDFSHSTGVLSDS